MNTHFKAKYRLLFTLKYLKHVCTFHGTVLRARFKGRATGSDSEWSPQNEIDSTDFTEIFASLTSREVSLCF
jgi:hypothetical protein